MVHVLRHWHALPLGQQSHRLWVRKTGLAAAGKCAWDHEPAWAFKIFKCWLTCETSASIKFSFWLLAFLHWHWHASLTLTCFYAQIHQPTALPARKSKDVFDRRLNANQWAKSTDIKYHQWHLVWAIAHYIYTYHLSVSWIALWFKMADPLEPGWFL